MKTTEVADKIRCIVYAEEHRAMTLSSGPIPWDGLSYQTQKHWQIIANAAGAVLGVTLEED